MKIQGKATQGTVNRSSKPESQIAGNWLRGLEEQADGSFRIRGDFGPRKMQEEAPF